ncbi:MAG: hypothetical protein JWM86_2277 [Thermoleophilia bacterium]|nr:hypothetical protein [Thermoleophilia bacterium]
MITTGMKIALGAAGAGLVGGIVAERMMSPKSIEQARDGDRWGALHDDFLKEHPLPAGTHLHVGTEPAWKNAAIAGGASLGVALLGAGMMFGAHKLNPQNYGLFVAGMSATALGGAGLIGTGASWAVR